jgi:O-antigen/teichoic acid export membrane protein
MLINSNKLGAAGVGTVGLIVLTITIILSVNEIIVGGALVYLIPRYQPHQILFPSYAWSLLNAGIFYILVHYIHFVDSIYNNHIILLSLILSLSNAHAIFLLGKQKIKEYNLIILLQYLLQLFLLILLFYAFQRISIHSYLISLYGGYLTAYMIGLFFVLKNIRKIQFHSLLSAVPALFRMGFIAQVSNIAQLLNYRLNYYLLEKYKSTFLLGKYVISMQLSESIWIVSRSVALVQYSNISNADNKSKSIRETIFFIKFIFIIAFIGMIIISIIPSSVYQFILGKDFSGIQPIILILFPGIVALSCSHPISSFFSGTGKIHINMFGSLAGLVVTVIVAFILIPRFGIYGAAVTNTFSYLVTFSFSLIMFIKTNRIKFSDLLIKSKDFTIFKRYIFTLLKVIKHS